MTLQENSCMVFKNMSGKRSYVIVVVLLLIIKMDVAGVKLE